ncbi:MAG: O-antigen ligase family protein [Bacteroidales bacterium]|nr:O-antigen ligase family protein [Bacteroidales bacterium]
MPSFQKKNIIWVYVFSLLFVLINSIFIANEDYSFLIVPFGLLAIFFGIFALDKLLFLVVFLTPLSVTLKSLGLEQDFDMFVPTEPILVGILIIFIFKLIIEQNFDKKILNHPISWAIYINVFWLLITSITSTIPLVSFKFLLVRIWFLAAFYFLATQIFRNKENFNRYIWLYIIPLLGVIFYTLSNHAAIGFFDQEAANKIMAPFYKDHTIYGAILAMYIPFLIGFAFNKKYYKPNMRFVAFAVLGILIVAIIFSYTRAAWLSLLGALALWIIIKLKIKYYLVLGTAAGLLGIFLAFQTQIMMELEENQQDSSTNLTEHVKSMSNVSSDASNLERINRWKSALRMYEERPFLGWGPGTYQFNYAPFQMKREKTIISTNAGDGGNAHSEYIGPMAESGLFGMISFALIAIASIFTALRLYSYSKNKTVRFLSLTILMALVTYLLHGFLNNFLDTDKASVPFWGFIAMLVALDVYHNKPEEEKSEEKG